MHISVPCSTCPLLPPGAGSSAQRRRSPRRSRAQPRGLLPPRSPSAAAQGRRSRSCAAPKIAEQHYVYTTFHTCEFCPDDRLYRDSANNGFGYNYAVIGRSLEPRTTDRAAPCAAAEGLRGGRRPRGCALDRRSASLARGPRARRQQRTGAAGH